MSVQEGITEGSFDSRAPRLQDMVGKSGGIDQKGGPGVIPFCGLFHPKFTDLIADSSGFSANDRLAPVDWDLFLLSVSTLSIIWVLGLRMYGCLIGRYDL